MIYVDELLNYGAKGTWCHMISDSGEEELIEFALRIGLKRSWIQRTSATHYDLTPSKRKLALENGAKPVTRRELGMLLRSLREKEGAVKPPPSPSG